MLVLDTLTLLLLLKWLFQNPEVNFLNINVSEFHAYKLDGVQVVADAKVALEAIDAELEKTGWKSAYTTEIADVKADMMQS